MRHLATLLLTIISAVTLAAQQPLRPVTSAFTIGVGSAHTADTYLSPLPYSGMRYEFDYERFQAMRFAPHQWVMRLNAGAFYEESRNPTGNSVMRQPGVYASWGMMRRCGVTVVERLTLAAGPMAQLDAGVLYLARNGNNPVNVRADLAAGVMAMATYGFRLKRLPVVVRYQASLPLLGAFFSPAYGELFYEIYLGNHAGLAHVAWPGNRFRLHSLLTADLRFGATAMRLGYSCRILTGKVNGLISRSFTHLLTIGISSEWITLSPSATPTASCETISAFY